MRPQSFFFARDRGNHGISGVVNTREGMSQIEPGSHPNARGGSGDGAQSMRSRWVTVFFFLFVLRAGRWGRGRTRALPLLWAGH
jgi:hypothetical protein